MNHTLHHFRKEVRYLLPRWIPWLFLLGVDLAVKMRWLFTEELPPETWLTVITVAPWLWGAWLVVTHVSEDNPGNVNRSSAVRPLPMSSYWLARALVFVCMLVLPFALQEGLHLLLVGRPIVDALIGMGWRSLLVVSYLGWLIPCTFLFRRFTLGLALLLMAASAFLALMISPHLMPHLVGARFQVESSVSDFYKIVCLLLLGIGLVLIVKWDSVKRLNLPGRLTWVAILTVILTLLSEWCASLGWSHRGSDSERAQEALKNAYIKTPPYTLSLYDDTVMSDWSGLHIRSSPEVIMDKSSLCFIPRATALKYGLDGKWRETVLPWSHRFQLSNFFKIAFESEYAMAAILANLPEGTLFSDGWGNLRSIELGRIKEPIPDKDARIELQSDWALDWVDWSVPLDTPLTVGSVANTSTSRWTMLAVQYDQDVSGKSLPGAVSIRYRVAWKPEAFREDNPGGVFLMLHSPERGMVWPVSESFRQKKILGKLSDWQEMDVSVCWENVLIYPNKDRAPVSLDKLRLIGVRPEYLGHTPWRPDLAPIRIREHLNSNNYALASFRKLPPDEETWVFEQRMQQLGVLSADSSVEQAKKYLYQVFLTAEATGAWRREPQATKLREILTEVFRDRLELAFRLPVSVTSRPKFVEMMLPMIQEQHRELVVANMFDHPWLVDVVRAKKWEDSVMGMLGGYVKDKQNVDYRIMQLMQRSPERSVQLAAIELSRRYSWGYYALQTVRDLSSKPELRADLKTMAQDVWQRVLPVASERERNSILIAVCHGNREALRRALMIVGQGPNDNYLPADWMENQLAQLLELPQAKTPEDRVDLIRKYRQMKVEDFQYHETKARWERKLP